MRELTVLFFVNQLGVIVTRSWFGWWSDGGVG